MIYAILKRQKFAHIGESFAVQATNTEKNLKMTLPLINLKNYTKVHKEVVKMVQ